MKKSQIVTFTKEEQLPPYAGYSPFFPPKGAPKGGVTLLDFKSSMDMMVAVYGGAFLEMLDKVISRDAPYIDPFIIAYRDAILRASRGRSGEIQIPDAGETFEEYKKVCARHGYKLLA